MLTLAKQTLRQAVRTLGRNPAFTIVAVATLALGMGATTAVVSIVNAVLLRPLPWTDPDRLVVLTGTRRGDEISVAYPDLLDWRAGSRVLDGIAAFAGQNLNLSGDGDPERLRAQVVSANLFRVLGVQPVLGRAFTPDEDRAGTERTVILGHALWQRRFGGAPDVLGRTIRLQDEPYLVVGVMPAGFDFPGGIVYGPAELWIPAGLMAEAWDTRDSHPGIVAIARLRAGAGLREARAEMDDIARRLEAAWPATNRDEGVMVRGALDSMVGEFRGALFLLLGGVALVLLIAMANVTNLLLVRAAGRQREMAVRHALGAARRHVLLQLTVESLVLTLAGAAAGLALAWGLTAAAGGLLADLPRGDVSLLEWRVAGAALVLSLLAGLSGGLAPMLATRTSVSSIALRSREGGPGTGRLRAALVVGETALALTLLVAAVVVLRSFVNLQADTGGIEPRGVLVWETNLPATRYAQGTPTAQFYRETYARVASLPGVEAVGGISTLPFSGSGAQSRMSLPGSQADEPTRTDVAVVTPEYFNAMGVPLVRGRVFTDADDGTVAVAVVDERFAEAFWPGADPIGQRVEGWGFEELTVVGVVRHVKNYGVMADSRPELFVPHAQRPNARMTGVARMSTDPAALMQPIRHVIAELDRDLPVYNVRSMEDVVGGTVSRPRMAAALSGSFAFMALGLAMIGLYGVLAHGVTQRTRELGIRLALGATPSGVMRLVLRQAVRLTFAGTVLGSLGAFGAVRLLRSLTYGVDPGDPRIFVLAAGLFMAAALAAAAWPARRAARIAPVRALVED